MGALLQPATAAGVGRDTFAKPLAGQVAIVTGASEGIGRAIAFALGAAGASVVVGYREGQASATAITRELALADVRARPARLDVTEDASVREVFADTDKAEGRIDILVNNAGIVRDQLAAAMSDEEWSSVIDTNLTGCFRCCRAAARYMIPYRRGKIVNVASVAAYRGGKGQANYAAAKAGMVALTRSLAVELAPKGICVNAVSPGVIKTRMSERVRQAAQERILSEIALNRFGRPEDVAGVVAFLCTPAADYVTGANVPVCGGYRL